MDKVVGLEEDTNNKSISRKKKRKCFRLREDDNSLILGEKFKMDSILEVSDLILVGRATGRRFKVEEIVTWFRNSWADSPAMASEVRILARG